MSGPRRTPDDDGPAPDGRRTRRVSWATECCGVARALLLPAAAKQNPPYGEVRWFADGVLVCCVCDDLPVDAIARLRDVWPRA